jgi:hypothetical protein
MDPDALQLTLGDPPVEVSTVLAEAVHPLPDCVTTTVYVPATVVVKEDPLPLGVQEYELMVLPAQAVALAVIVLEVIPHDSGPLFEAVTVGRQVSIGALHELLAVHPLDCVTVTV